MIKTTRARGGIDSYEFHIPSFEINSLGSWVN
jgi:hypothetical protein